jgi:ParB family transcriptional regulator, chromosome partitioning protein
MAPERSTGLGRGIDALLPSGVRQVLDLPWTAIRPNRMQPRQQAEEAHLEELAGSIERYGILQPVVVAERDEEGMYELIAGERRWRAAGLAGKETVPALIRSVGEQERLELALVENVQRVDLSPLEQAQAYRQLQAEFGLSQESIAGAVGKSRSTVANTIRLLDLPGEALRAIAEGRITEGHARAILAVRDPAGRVRLLRQILEEGMTVRVAEGAARKARAPGETHCADNEAEALAEAFGEALQTRVEIRRSGKGGRVIVHFYGDEDLQALFERIVPASDVSRETYGTSGTSQEQSEDQAEASGRGSVADPTGE